MKTKTVQKRWTKRVTSGEGSEAGRSILRGLREIRDVYASGEPLEKRFRVRTVEVAEPGEYDMDAIIATRRKLGLSQAIFARLVGVSPSLAQSWEQGRRMPDAMARRILDEINRQPKHWSAMVLRSN